MQQLKLSYRISPVLGLRFREHARISGRRMLHAHIHSTDLSKRRLHRSRERRYSGLLQLRLEGHTKPSMVRPFTSFLQLQEQRGQACL